MLKINSVTVVTYHELTIICSSWFSILKRGHNLYIFSKMLHLTFDFGFALSYQLNNNNKKSFFFILQRNCGDNHRDKRPSSSIYCSLS